MALSRHHVGTSKPLSVQEIVRQAEDFEFYVERPLQSWLRSARMLLTEAAICEDEGNLRMAYLYIYRHAELILSKLPRHPEAKDARSREELSQARKQVNRNLVKLEQWKPRIDQEYRRYVEARQRRLEGKQRVHDERNSAEQHAASSVGSIDDAYHEERKSLDATENKGLAVALARQELQRRDITKQSTRRAGISPGTVAARRKGSVFDYSATEGLPEDQGNEAGNGSQGVREIGHMLQQQSRSGKSSSKATERTTHRYHYPTVPDKESKVDWNSTSFSSVSEKISPPALPPKEISNYRMTSNRGDVPSRPAKVSLEALPDVGSTPSEQDSATKYTFKSIAATESGAPLRTVLIPPGLRQTFLDLAHPNTARNLETCGVLCATSISNALFISHLVVPDQTSTSDTCDATEEGDVMLFDFCDRENLLVCGWIHTHPSQSCFLSSRDLHTSSGYQQMLPEAIAIVCAPRHNPDWGMFRLTDPPGLPAVLKCQRKGLFHPHDETNLYTDAESRGGHGHVVEAPGLKFQTVDLRKS